MMSHALSYLLIFCVVGVAAWTLAGYLVIRNIEQPQYTLLEEHEGYELRDYEPYIVAEATVQASTEREALTEGFRLVADYIFGNNTKATEISMTAPVISTEENEKIAMTSPVISTEETTGTWTVSFVMPRSYTLETLPTPNNTNVVLREVPGRVVAVRQFSWMATNARIQAQKDTLREALIRDDMATVGPVQYAGYNPPLTAPFMQRHEVFITIK